MNSNKLRFKKFHTSAWKVRNAYSKLTLENTEEAIWNVQLRDTGTVGYT